MLELYYSPGACATAAHIVANEAGVPVDPIKVDLKTHRTADGRDFHEINPRGYVPALRLDDGEVITEAGVVVQYLADLAGATELMPPAGTIERVRVQEWLTYVGTELHKSFSPLFDPEAPEAVKAYAKAALVPRLEELDGLLAERPYLTGGAFTVADAYAFIVLGWSGHVGIDLSVYPSIPAYLARIAERPKVRLTLEEEGLA